MTSPAVLEPVPLEFPEDGSPIRVSGSRLTLDTIVRAFKRGATAEEIAQDFSAVSLSDAYAIIAYYLRHRATIDEYMAGRAIQHAKLRREIEKDSDYQEFRGRLLARKKAARRGQA